MTHNAICLRWEIINKLILKYYEYNWLLASGHWIRHLIKRSGDTIVLTLCRISIMYILIYYTIYCIIVCNFQCIMKFSTFSLSFLIIMLNI